MLLALDCNRSWAAATKVSTWFWVICRELSATSRSIPPRPNEAESASSTACSPTEGAMVTPRAVTSPSPTRITTRAATAAGSRNRRSSHCAGGCSTVVRISASTTGSTIDQPLPTSQPRATAPSATSSQRTVQRASQSMPWPTTSSRDGLREESWGCMPAD